MECWFEITAQLKPGIDELDALDVFLQVIIDHSLSANGGFNGGFCIARCQKPLYPNLSLETDRLAIKEYMEDCGDFDNIVIGEIQEEK